MSPSKVEASPKKLVDGSAELSSGKAAKNTLLRLCRSTLTSFCIFSSDALIGLQSALGRLSVLREDTYLEGVGEGLGKAGGGEEAGRDDDDEYRPSPMRERPSPLRVRKSSTAAGKLAASVVAAAIHTPPMSMSHLTSATSAADFTPPEVKRPELL